MNRVILLGNITRDIELRHTSANQAVAKFGLAVNRKWKDASGEAREEVMFIDCEAWGKTAELINSHFAKGKQILVEGRLKLDQWEDKEGGKRSKHVLSVDSFHFTGAKEAGAKEPVKARAQVPAGRVPEDEIPFD